MRTTLNIDDQLYEEAVRLTGVYSLDFFLQGTSCFSVSMVGRLMSASLTNEGYRADCLRPLQLAGSRCVNLVSQ